MTITGETWTCPACGVVEVLDVPDLGVDDARQLAEVGHRERHAAERGKATTITAALLEAIEQLAAFRVRLVVAPADVERVRELVKRRAVPIEVFAGDLEPGSGYVMQPRRGVRELHR